MMLFKRGVILMLFVVCVHQNALSVDTAESLRNPRPSQEQQVISHNVGLSGLDRVSSTCLQCHSGETASDIMVGNARASRGFNSHLNASHPVGMLYQDHYMKAPQIYKRPEQVSRNIPLVDGKVSCASCHKHKQGLTLASSHRSQRDNNANCIASKELTVGPRQTDLCMACHDI